MRPWKLSLWLILTAGSLIFVCKTNVRIVTSSVPKRFVSPGARTTVPHAHLPPRAVSEPIPITAPTDSREASVMGAAIREDFPILSQRIHENKPLIYLDSAATSQKPSRVRLKLREAMKRASTEGVQALKEDYERARGLVADFINAGSSREVCGGSFFRVGEPLPPNTNELTDTTFSNPNVHERPEIYVISLSLLSHSSILPNISMTRIR
eukprot:54578-Amorphochlora_amoeboformis.AAC.1